ncbi:MAG: two-component system sensor histidine kinase CreC [Desulfovibrio sp.]|nr:two-component system sensor histidine kinase CreC [Desulfovibrio sp.]
MPCVRDCEPGVSLRLRIIITFALLMAASFTVVIRLILSDVRPRYLEAVEEAMVDTAEFIAAMLSGSLEGEDIRARDIKAVMEAVKERRFEARIYDMVKRGVSMQIYVTDARGMLIYDSTGGHPAGEDFSRWRDVYLTLRGRYGARSTRVVAADASTQVLFVAAPVRKDGRIVGVVSVGKPTNGISFLIDIAKRRFVFSLLLVGLAALAVSVALSFWITRPLKRLIDWVLAVQRGEGRRLLPLGTPEIGVLGAAMEEMQARLEGKNYIEDYVRALTHELKSPLTGIKGAGEILRDHVTDETDLKFLDNIDSEVDRMHSLVDRMLQLSRLENVRAIDKTRFGAQAFFQGLADSFHVRLTAEDIRLELEVQAGLSMDGDELLLRQAVGNLVANALDFSPAGTLMRIRAVKAGDKLVITVRDHGAGIPDFALDKAFDKFFSLSRPDTGKKSTGLGLPFVAEVMTLHGGSVRLANADPGLEATLELPC